MEKLEGPDRRSRPADTYKGDALDSGASGALSPGLKKEGVLTMVAVKLGRLTARLGELFRPKVAPKKSESSTEALWQRHQMDVEMAKDHPTSSILDQFFLHPEVMTAEARETVKQHVDTCARCGDIAVYYQRNERMFRLMKGEPCD